MHDQDSRPPTPKQRNMTLEDPTGLVSMQDFFRETNGAAIDEANHMPSQGNVEQAEERKLGTFKKIAGLVRRGSLGHSLKGPTTGEPGLSALLMADISNASYIAEHQENLLAVQVMFYGLSSTQKDDLIVETEKNVQAGCGVSEAIITSKRDASVSLRIALPTAVAVGQTVQFVQSDLHLETKLSALPTSVPGAVSSLNTMLKHPLSAPELRKYRPNALCCTACDREVADLSRTLQSEDRLEGAGFKDLPSEHWAEMLEVWMCHDDPAFTAQLAQRTNEGFWPTRDTVLVGGSYLLVHSDVGKQASLQAEAGNVSDHSPPFNPPQHCCTGYKKVFAILQLAVRLVTSIQTSAQLRSSSKFLWEGRGGCRDEESDRVTPLTDTTVQERCSLFARKGGHGFNPLSWEISGKDYSCD